MGQLAHGERLSSSAEASSYPFFFAGALLFPVLGRLSSSTLFCFGSAFMGFPGSSAMPHLESGTTAASAAADVVGFVVMNLHKVLRLFRDN